jgi:acetylornithine/N-succinyldiaminopimelate aminotransferase
MSYLMSNYKPLDISFKRGKGCYLFTDDGEKYLDALTGVAVVNLGHSHDKIVKTIKDQAEKLIHTSNWYRIDNQETLGEKLCAASGMEKVFFGNSGAEANEAAIKLTRLYAHKKGIENPIIITAINSFHGRTMAALSATGNDNVKKGFYPVLPGFIHVDYNNIDQLKAITNNKNVVAVMLEPIQGESGVRIPDVNYLNEVQALCQKNNWLFIIDEVQTGMGRTGKLFAHQHDNLKPDIITLAKGLGNGYPIGACLARGEASQLFTPGTHGSTFGGNPMASAVAGSVLEIIEAENILDNVNTMSTFAKKLFLQRLEKSSKVTDFRIKGLMIGIELNKDPSSLLQKGIENKILINITGNTIRLLPPLIINEIEVSELVDKVCNLIDEL